MAWEYLENFDYRYKLVSEYITDDDFVVELNSGNSRLRDYVKNHTCNDLYDSRADYQITDKEFAEKIEKCDVLVCLGVGGFEIDGEKLESPTITNTIIGLVKKFKPRLLIVENVVRYIPIVERILEDTGYKASETHYHQEPGDWTRKRKMFICKM